MSATWQPPLPSLLSHTKKGCTIIYLIQPLSLLLSCLNAGSQPARHPARQPGSEHIVGPEGSRVDNLCCVHMAEQSAGEEDWHAETKQVYDSEA